MKKFLAILMSAVMLLGLSVTAFAAEGDSPGRNVAPVAPGGVEVPPAADEVEAPPKLEKKAEGKGETEDGKSIEVVEWDPKDTDFKDEDEAIDDAVNSDALKDALDKLKLKVSDLTGSSLAAINIEDNETPVTVVFLYGDDGTPVIVLFYYDGNWGETTDIEETDEDGVYTVTFGDADSEDGDLTGTVDVTIADAEEDK